MAARQMIFRLRERNRGMRSRQMTVMLSLKRTEKQEVALSGLKVDEDVYGMVKGPRQSSEDYTPLFSITYVMEDLQYTLALFARIVRSVQRSMRMAIIVSRTTIRT